MTELLYIVRASGTEVWGSDPGSVKLGLPYLHCAKRGQVQPASRFPKQIGLLTLELKLSKIFGFLNIKKKDFLYLLIIMVIHS